MPVYKYVAVNLQKQKFKGKYIATDEKDLAVQLAKQNLYLVSASVSKRDTPSAFFTLGTGKVKLKELTTFCRQFAIMLTSGVQVMGALDIMKAQPFSAYFRSILQTVSEDVKGGERLSDALAKHKKVFPGFFISMVRVGEASGQLEMVFVLLADWYESDSAIKRKARSAMIYPTMLLFMAVAIVVLLLTFVVPRFKSFLSAMEIQPTGYTAFVYGVSDFLTENWQILLAVVIVVTLLIFVFFRTKQGRKIWDVLKVKTPILGKITIDLMTARFARAFYILLASGMDLASALDATVLIIGNSYVEKRFKEAANDVRQGVPITDAFRKYNIFPELLLQMLFIGETTNTLDEVLGRSCKFFDTQVEDSLNSITSKIQPILLIIIGAIIGSLFLAVYAPMLSVMQNLTI